MRSKLMLALVIAAQLAFPLSGIVAQTPGIVPDEVQEDWVLVVGTPDIVGVGPQITTAMSPVSDGSTPFVAFDLNYREYPSFQVGGMQAQVWSGDDVLATSSHGSNQFTTTNETVNWTQQMSISQSGSISYHIMNGQSTTWGNFGGGSQKPSVNYSTSLGSLSGYSPDSSVANSGASWESNYVTQLSLVQVRYYAAGRLIGTDTTQRDLIARPAGN